MNLSIRSLFIPALALFLLLLPSSCRKQETVFAPEKTPEPVVEETALTAVETPQYTQAMITFLSGEVFVAAGGDWEYAEIGNFLEREDTLRVDEESYCELQFGDIGAMRIEANTEIFLKDVYLEPENSSVGVKIAVGSVLAKVSKLSGGDKFTVESQVAVCGVRGTEFGVKVTEDGKTRLAVKEGKVAVLPVNIDLDELKEKIQEEIPGEIPEKNEKLLEIVEKIEQQAPVVADGQELTIGEETIQETEEVFKAVVETVEKIIEQEQEVVSAESVEELEQLVEQTTTRVSEVIEAPIEITEESAAELQTIDKIKLVEIPVAPAAAREVTAEEERPQPEIKLEKIAIAVTPRDAHIFINGEQTGKGRFSGLFAHGETLDVEINKDGYLAHKFTVIVEKDSGKLYTIALEKKPLPKEKISIRVSPRDAEIFMDGKSLGKGDYTGEFEVGQTLNFRITRQNYGARTLNVDVTEGSGRLYEIALEEDLREIAVATNPLDAKILLNGEVVGTGSYTESFPVSETLSFVVRREGYADQELSIKVAGAAARAYEIELEELRRKIVLQTRPTDAEIFLDGKRVGRGRYSGEFPFSRNLNFRVSRSGYVDKSLTLRVADAQDSAYILELGEQTRRIVVRTIPADAEIILDGRIVGRGTFSRLFPLSGRVALQIRKEGYKPQILTIDVREAKTTPYSVTLKGMPITSRLQICEAPITGNVLVTPDRMYLADETGRLYALSRQGRTFWSIPTKNLSNENSFPVMIGNNIYLSGSDEFVIVNSSNGNVITRLNLDRDYSHLFGRRVVPYKQFAIFPANNSLRLINRFTGETMNEIEIPGGARMTPAVYNDRALIVNQEGEFLVVDLEQGTIESRIKTGAVQPIAITVSIYNDLAYFAGRKGRVVCVDLAEERVLWEVPLPGRKLRGVFQDLEVGRDGVFAFSEGNIYGFSLNEGDSLFQPIQNASSPPLYREEQRRLYFGATGQTLLAADTRGRILKALNIGEIITTRPRFEDGSLIVGTEGGKLLTIKPELME